MNGKIIVSVLLCGLYVWGMGMVGLGWWAAAGVGLGLACIGWAAVYERRGS